MLNTQEILLWFPSYEAHVNAAPLFSFCTNGMNSEKDISVRSETGHPSTVIEDQWQVTFPSLDRTLGFMQGVQPSVKTKLIPWQKLLFISAVLWQQQTMSTWWINAPCGGTNKTSPSAFLWELIGNRGANANGQSAMRLCCGCTRPFLINYHHKRNMFGLQGLSANNARVCFIEHIATTQYILRAGVEITPRGRP